MPLHLYLRLQGNCKPRFSVTSVNKDAQIVYSRKYLIDKSLKNTRKKLKQLRFALFNYSNNITEAQIVETKEKLRTKT